MTRNVLQIDPRDNVLVALGDLRRGDSVVCSQHTYTLVSDVSAKHKFAARDFSPGESIIMYGVPVGEVTRPIARGEALNTLNVRHHAAEFHRRDQKYSWTAPDVQTWKDKTFQGFHRCDGRVGTRNHWLVLPLVFCENRNLDVLKQAFQEELGFAAPQIYRHQVADLARLYREGKLDEVAGYQPPLDPKITKLEKVFPRLDGLKFLVHEMGCGGTREDARNLCALFAGYISHPNVAGATVLSLGCQNAQVSILREELAKRNPHGHQKPLLVYEQQQWPSERAMLSAAVRDTFLGLIDADKAARKPAPLAQLTFGLKCGGSDGFSGISANPAVGHLADLLVALGGTGILSEFPELCGVEQNLVDRCIDEAVADRFIELMRDYASRAKAVRSGFEMNPSPGNIRDGLITDAMKSAGAAKKGGTSPVTAVLDYPEPSFTPGLNLQCTPGNDVECVTAQVAAGANIVLFTTGLGTPTGNPITPVVKISTNSALAARMNDLIDLDAGGVISGETTIAQAAESILNFVIRVASGEVLTKAETLEQNDFIPWKRGVSL